MRLDQLYFQIVRHMDYTWDDLMQEDVCKTMYTFEELEREGQKKKERREEIQDEVDDAKSQV